MPTQDAPDQDRMGLMSDATMSTLHLQHQPFTAPTTQAMQGEQDANLLFRDTITEEQLADIKQALITGDDLLLVLGEHGSGKSTLLKQLDADSGLRIQCVPVPGSQQFSTSKLFSDMLAAFNQEPPAKLKDILDELIPCLQSMVARNTLCTIVLDDAHTVKQEELTQLLSGMLYLNSQDETLVRVALAATEDFEDGIPDLLPEGADMPYSSLTIEGLSPPRAAAYLDHRLQLAGFDQQFPFTEQDMESLVEHSQGRPSALNALTADVLNEKYGRVQDMPGELMSSNSSGFMQSRFGKLALGAVAAVLIVGGLLMFMPKDNASRQLAANDNNDATNANDSAEATELVLIDQDTAQPEEPVVTIEPENPVTEASPEPATNPTTDNTQETAQNSASSTDTDSESSPASVDSSADSSDAETATDISSGDTDSFTAGDNLVIQAPTDTDPQPEPEPDTPDPATDGSADSPSNDTDIATSNDAEEQNQSSETQADDVSASNASSENNPTPDGSLESPTWILVQDDEKFTIQMSASRDLASVESFLRRNPLPSPNSIFSFERNGDIWYALVHGSFDTISEAQRAVERMSDSAQRDQPWIRSVGRVKGILRQP